MESPSKSRKISEEDDEDEQEKSTETISLDERLIRKWINLSPKFNAVFKAMIANMDLGLDIHYKDDNFYGSDNIFELRYSHRFILVIDHMWRHDESEEITGSVWFSPITSFYDAYGHSKNPLYVDENGDLRLAVNGAGQTLWRKEINEIAAKGICRQTWERLDMFSYDETNCLYSSKRLLKIAKSILGEEAVFHVTNST